jgi:hypothetical protein
MTMGWQEQLQSGAALREIVRQATNALIRMDAERLEELARCCADLNQELHESRGVGEAAKELREAADDMKLLGRVLLETRANLTLLTRLRTIRVRQEDGRAGRSTDKLKWRERTVEYGDN